ncbi:Na-Ca exchanger/integrin-beta4 [Calothrix brevissima NIES-22]|nr:Na-Ca exchanger/integrin-beta4 [Calothrix brevissima NIES-22]
MIINGTANQDELYATKDEQIFGLEGDDIIDATNGQGNNLLDGGSGNDQLFANNHDTLRGGIGKDNLFAVSDLGFNTLLGEEDSDRLFVVEGSHNLLNGGAGNDFLNASNPTGNNTLEGGEGDDLLIGGLNSDRLFGGAGDDSLFAGINGSQFTGGSGLDRFYLTSAGVPDIPVEVLDFTKNQDKVIVAGIPEVKRFQDLKIEQILVNSQPGPDTSIKATINGELKELGILRNVQADSLTPDDFDFSDVTDGTGNSNAGITIIQTDGSTKVSEDGLGDRYSVVLNSKPQADVTIAIKNGKQTQTSVNSLTFTPQNWNLTQEVTVIAVDDAIVEGDRNDTIEHTAFSSDANYDKLAINPVNVSITDNDIPLTKSGDIFTIKGESERARLQVTLTGHSSKLVNELGVYVVDDAQGTINGIAPGAAGYAQAALERARVIFSAIAKIPNGFTTNNIQSLLEFNSGENLRFFLVKNSTIDAVKSGISSINNVIFSSNTTQQITDLGADSFSLAWQDSSGNNTNNFQDLVVKIQATNNPLFLGTNLQSQSQGELIDLREVTQPVKAEFIVNREAAFDNFVGFYRATDKNGGIDINNDGIADILPGQSGYAQAAVRGRIPEINLTARNQSTATYNDILQPGYILVPFIIINGRPDAFNDNNLNNNPTVYLPFLGANSDKTDHIRLLGNNVFGFEDLANGGDGDFNDVLIKVNLSLA